MSSSSPAPALPSYATRVRQLEAEGLTTSDAQGVADVEVEKGLCLPDGEGGEPEGIASIISPEIVERIAKEAVAGTYKKACDHLLHDFYDACGTYLHEHFSNLENDIWREISNQVIRGYSDGKWSKYNHKELRETLLREHREDLIRDLNKDLLEENEQLKKDLEWERSIRRSY